MNTMVQTEEKSFSHPDINDMLPGDLLADDETVVFAIKPSLWAVAFVSFRTVLIASLLALGTFILGPAIHLGEYGIYLIELCGLVIFGRIGFALLQWASRTYVLTDRRVIRIRGVLTIDIFQSHLARIQNTFVVLTLPERIFGLGDIQFTTAGTGGVEAVWRHLKNPLPIHHQLLRAMNAVANQNPTAADDTLESPASE
jgi:uncharacterized membrane protein YdbT with pleckstrin-like domain